MDWAPTPTPTGGREPALPSGVAPLAPEDPVSIGGYALAGRLGAGGMGRVYLGRDPDGGLAAVKVAHARLAGDEEVHARLRAEADCLARVPASCTARLLADGTDQLPPHLITEYLPGRSLKDVVERDGPLAPEPLRALAAGIALTLSSIHEAGLVHRDLKPANVILTPAGPRVIDFGIAQQVDASGGPTRTGMVVGSVGWIAPERLTRQPATPASDVFGWGCLIAYAGTGRNAYGTGDAEELARRTLFEAPDLEGLDLSVRPSVAAALARVPADRPSAAELLVRLGADDPLDVSGPVSRTQVVSRLIRGPRPRRRALIAAVAATAMVGVGATATAWMPTAAPHGASQSRGAATIPPKPPSSATPGSAVISRDPAQDRRKTRTSGRAGSTGPAAKKPAGPAAKKPPPEEKPGPGKKKPKATGP